MKICIITDYLKPQINGIAIRFEEYIKNLRFLGHDVYVYGPSQSQTSDRRLYSITNYFNPSNVICFPTFELMFDLLYNKYDIVHIVYPPAVYVLLIWLITIFVPLNIVTSNHVMLLDYSKAYFNELLFNILFNIVKYIIYYPQLYFAKKILGPSSYSDFNLLFNKKIEIIPTGINIDLFKPLYKKKDNVLLFVGRLAPEKNIDKLISILPENYKLQLIGDGPENERLINQYANNKNIEFLGKIDHTELCSYYQNAKAHITLSVSETYCLTLIESLACGTPIIYADCDVFNEIYEKDFGELCFKKNNLETILKYIEENEVNLQKKCRKYTETKTWLHATKDLVNIYESVCKIKNI